LGIIAIASVVAIAVIAFVVLVGPRSIPAPEPVSPFAHLDERKAAIYENLRDLQFEYRVGKLSEADYQSAKRDLQKELAAVLEEIDRLARAPVHAPPKRVSGFACPACGAAFDKPLKFCGECGKPMQAGTA
jgi:hypothetical protein